MSHHVTMVNKGDGEMKETIELSEIMREVEAEKAAKRRKHNDQVIDEIARDLQKSLKEKRKADLTTIKMYMMMLELRLK